MGKIVRASPEKRQSKFSTLRDKSFILNETTPFFIKEEYKTLRTNVMFSIPSEGCKVIGVSSAQSMEEKASTA